MDERELLVKFCYFASRWDGRNEHLKAFLACNEIDYRFDGDDERPYEILGYPYGSQINELIDAFYKDLESK